MAEPQQQTEQKDEGKLEVSNYDNFLTLENAILDDSDWYDEEFDENPEAEIDNSSNNRRLWRMLSTPIITVLVGPSERHFQLHQGLLRRHSLFFRQMLRSGHFSEAKDRIVKLPEDDVTTFAVFAEWLYLGDECDTGAVFKDVHGKDASANDDGFLGNIQSIKSTVFHAAKEKEEEMEVEDGTDDTNVEDGSEGSVWETGSTVDPLGVHDHYDFSLQFSCYVLADKLQAPGFKRLILDEIRSSGEICDPANLTADHVRYAYENTIRDHDPLRRFCIMLKCVRTPIEETLADDDFLALMEGGGPLVRDVMQVYQKTLCKKSKKIDDLRSNAEPPKA